jgi:hypothetical protein
MQRLGKNIGAYRGDTIQIRDVLIDIEDAGKKAGWKCEPLSAGEELHLHTWQRNHTGARSRIYLSTGIHGDEPAGPLAVRQLLQENRWPDNIDIWLCPCLNPTGFLSNTRENAQGVDLNRQYFHLEAPETRAHIEWLQRQPTFDVASACTRTGKPMGFILRVEPGQPAFLAEKIIRSVSQVCPIDPSAEIEGGCARRDHPPQHRSQLAPPMA